MQYTKKEIIRNMLLVVFGSLISSTGFVMFFEPSGINCGGISGVAMLIKYVAKSPYVTIGLVSAIINIPLFLVGFKKIGKYFFFGSMLGMVISAVGFDLLGAIVPIPEVEPLVAVIFGATIIGFGLGVVFLAGASTGGVDILARLLKLKFRNCPIGKLILAMDIITVALTGLVFGDISKALYSAVTLYVCSIALDGVVYGLDYSTVALIISDRHDDISQAIMDRLERGVTILDGHGYYSGQNKQVILSAIKKRQVAELKALVTDIDPSAFIILQESHQVLGEGFKRYNKNDL